MWALVVCSSPISPHSRKKEWGAAITLVSEHQPAGIEFNSHNQSLLTDVIAEETNQERFLSLAESDNKLRYLKVGVKLKLNFYYSWIKKSAVYFKQLY